MHMASQGQLHLTRATPLPNLQLLQTQTPKQFKFYNSATFTAQLKELPLAQRF
jgi:hypothetical protein